MLSSIPIIKVSDVQSLVENEGFQIVDVRSDDEYSGELGHIRGGKLITLGEGLTSFLEVTDPKKKIIFICRSGNRSGQATEMAVSKGFTNVFNMEGGMLEWNQQGLEVEK